MTDQPLPTHHMRQFLACTLGARHKLQTV